MVVISTKPFPGYDPDTGDPYRWVHQPAVRLPGSFTDWSNPEAPCTVIFKEEQGGLVIYEVPGAEASESAMRLSVYTPKDVKPLATLAYGETTAYTRLLTHPRMGQLYIKWELSKEDQ